RAGRRRARELRARGALGGRSGPGGACVRVPLLPAARAGARAAGRVRAGQRGSRGVAGRAARRAYRAELCMGGTGLTPREGDLLGKKRNHAPIGTLVGPNTRVLGDIEFTGGCHVDGYVKG